jgi:hypothetical protein
VVLRRRPGQQRERGDNLVRGPLQVRRLYELAVDGSAIARLGDDGSVEALQVTEEKQDGATVKSEAKFEVIGTLDDAGTFTIKKSGKQVTIDDKGKVVGLPRDLVLAVTARPEHRKAAMLIVMGMLGSTRMTSDTSSSKSAPPKK